MKKIFFTLTLLTSISLLSQEENKFWDNVRFGGGLGLSFGNVTTLALSPSGVYDFKNGFSLGSGLNYQYSKTITTKTSIYGISAISLYQIPKTNFQLSGEYEHLWATQNYLNNKSYFNFPALYFGAAYNQGRFAFGFRYDVLFDENKSIFASPISPIVRFYF